jgi:hypothetical protein
MKLFVAGLLCVACIAISAQDQPDNRVHFACTAVTPLKLLKCQTTLGPQAGRQLINADPPYRSVEDFARRARVGDPWWPRKSNDLIVVTFAASGIQQDARVFRLQGNAEIHTATQVVEAADAVYHSDTGDGDVRVKPAGTLQ